MINTILNGFLSISMNVLNWFLDPIWNLIDDINIGGTTIGDMLASVNGVFNLISTTMSWIIDATAIPRPIFLLMFGIYLTCISLRVGIYLVKMILRWWDKIIA